MSSARLKLPQKNSEHIERMAPTTILDQNISLVQPKFLIDSSPSLPHRVTITFANSAIIDNILPIVVRTQKHLLPFPIRRKFINFKLDYHTPFPLNTPEENR